jgi:hypothetical protein
MIALLACGELRAAICLWFLRAEREYRFALEAVQKEGSDAARARYATARRDLDAATKVTEHLVTWPSLAEARA